MLKTLSVTGPPRSLSKFSNATKRPLAESEGLPLPLISYGGTSMVTLLIGFGMLMSINSERRFSSG